MTRADFLSALLVFTACGGRTPGGPPGDAAPLADATPQADAAARYLCTEAGPVEATGTTPLGAYAAHVAVFGIQSGECSGIELVLLASAADLARLGQGLWGTEGPDVVLVLYPDTWNFETQSYVGEGQVQVSLSQGAQYVYATGTIAITEADVPVPWEDPPAPGLVRATFAVDDATDGWQLSGTIEAEHCATVDVACP